MGQIRRRGKRRLRSRSPNPAARIVPTEAYLHHLDDLQRRIRSACDNLRGRSYEAADSVLASIDNAAAIIGVGAFRHFRCAVREIGEGDERESGVHIRAVWEGAADLALILAWREKKHGKERSALAERYLAFYWVGAPVAGAAALEHPDPQVRRLIAEMRSKHDVDSRDPKTHWSRLSRDRRRALVGPKIDQLVGTGEAMYEAVRTTTYSMAALQGHADPASELLMPFDAKGRADPAPRPDFPTVNPLSAWVVGGLLLLVLSDRLGPDAIAESRRAMQDAIQEFRRLQGQENKP